MPRYALTTVTAAATIMATAKTLPQPTAATVVGIPASCHPTSPSIMVKATASLGGSDGATMPQGASALATSARSVTQYESHLGIAARLHTGARSARTYVFQRAAITRWSVH